MRPVLPVLILLAFTARVAVGLFRGPDFFEQGYAFYTDIAASVLRGDGFCYAPGEGCAIRMPLYPAILAPFLSIGFVYPGLVVLQSALGAMQVWLAALLGRALFNARTGSIAAVMTALNPYAVIHDSAFQETVVFNTLVLLAGVLLLRAGKMRSPRVVIAASVTLGLAMLTSGRMALFLPCAIGWAVLAGGEHWRVRLERATLMAAVLAILAGGWMLRNWRVAGAPVLSTETGSSLWVANNPTTLMFYPRDSIDLNTQHAWAQLAPGLQRALASATELERDRMFAALAFDYVRDEPWRATLASARKVAAGFSGQLSPARPGLAQWAFAVIFVPIHVLAAIGLWRARRPWSSGHALSALLFASFAVTTAIFWAHTSHGSYLHPWLFIYASATLASLASDGRVGFGHS